MGDFLKKLAGLSPAIGSVIGGPVGGLLGSGIKVAASLITGKAEPEAIMEALIAHPEKLLALEAEVKKAELEELRIHAGDRDSARDANVELAKAKHGSAWAPAVVSVIVTMGFFATLGFVFFSDIPENNEKVVYLLLGTLTAGFTQVLNYWLGSSRGSKEKTLLMSLK